MSSSDEDGDANGAHPFVLVRVRMRVHAISSSPLEPS